LGKPPCEYRVKYVLPAIRAAVATVLERDFGLSPYRVAKVLGITPAAICNYRSLRRSSARLLEEILSRDDIVGEVRSVASKLVSGTLDPEEAMCSLCRKLADSLAASSSN
jgi:predicted transcriptional regulator